MIPDELMPRQQSEDPVANDPDASGAGAVSGVESDRGSDRADEPVDDRP